MWTPSPSIALATAGASPPPGRCDRIARGDRLARALRRADVHGLTMLAASELIAIVAARRRPRLVELQQVAERSLAERDLAELARAHPRELEAWIALDRREALRLAAAFELGRRAVRCTGPARPSLGSPARVHRLVASELAGLAHETFLVLLLDGKHRLVRCERVSEGTLTTSLVHPREVFRHAVREPTAAVIAVHNHPSGDPEPSPEDLDVTRRLVEAGKLLGVPLLDHVIVAGERYTSLRERLGF